jgi:type IV pilus assembly protein PilM
VERWFPVPALLLPRSIGVDISDVSVKWIGLIPVARGGYEVATHGSLPIPNGAIQGGAIKDIAAVAAVLRQVRITSKVSHAHAALPEEEAYVFSMYIPSGTPREQAMRLIEFEFEGRVPIPIAEAVYDFDIISEEDSKGTQIGVTVFPKRLAEQYATIFAEAGFELVSLEIEARSIGRAIDDGAHDEYVTLLVDFGRARTGFAVLKRGIPIFTSTVEFGNDLATSRAREKSALSEEEIQHIRNDEGLFATGEHAALRTEFEATALGLAGEVVKHFHFWDTRRDEHGERVTPVGAVALVGGSANMKGLVDLISGKVQAPTTRPDIWRHILDFNETIPPIDKRTSLQYVTAAGLALRGV